MKKKTGPAAADMADKAALAAAEKEAEVLVLGYFTETKVSVHGSVLTSCVPLSHTRCPDVEYILVAQVADVIHPWGMLVYTRFWTFVFEDQHMGSLTSGNLDSPLHKPTLETLTDLHPPTLPPTHTL